MYSGTCDFNTDRHEGRGWKGGGGGGILQRTV